MPGCAVAVCGTLSLCVALWVCPRVSVCVHHSLRNTPVPAWQKCDDCGDASAARQAAIDKALTTSLTVVPDEVAPGVLYIGSRESAYNLDTLRRLGVGQVLVCCGGLPEYHAGVEDLTYHRLPIVDALDQGLAL